MMPLADHNPTRTLPIFNLALIATCVLAYFAQTASPYGFEWSVYTWGFIPARLLVENLESLPIDHNMIDALQTLQSPPLATVFTSMFMHGSIMHLGGNMLYLWVFGDNVENDLGKIRYLLFYLLCGIAAVAAQAVVDPTSTIPMVGASGAISGVLGAYIVLHPRQPITVLMPNVGVTQVPALLVLGLWFVTQLLYGFASNPAEGGVAFWAHIGGFVAGAILVKPFSIGTSNSNNRPQLWR